ncbi:MAG: DUF4832 domain-containing protein [Planctomycetota bacterium]
MPHRPVRTAVVMKITPAGVIGRILELLRVFPELAESLPLEYRSAAFWQKTFRRNARARQFMATLQELPLFTNLAPRQSTRAAWEKVIEPVYGIRSCIRMPKLDVIMSQKSLPVTLAGLANLLNGTVKTAEAKPVKRKPVRRWRDRFGVKEVIQCVRPAETNDWLPNPHRGTTTFQRFQGDDTYPTWDTSDTHGPTQFTSLKQTSANVKYIPRTTLTYIRWPWRWLEPVKGKYNWDIIDGSLRTVRERGQTAQMRFQPYTRAIDYAQEPNRIKVHPPEKSVNVPDWYWATGAKWIKKGVYTANEPDSNDPLYLRHFGDFIRAFARRYDGHPGLESIDVAYAGFWGESGGNSTAVTGAKLSDIYINSFKKTQLLTMLGTAGATYAAARKRGQGPGIGWRADCFGDLRWVDVPEVPQNLCFNHTYDSYPKEIFGVGMDEIWKTAPITMETCGNVATWFLGDFDLDFIMDQGYKYHMSVFMPKNVFFPEKYMDRLIEFDKKIGYRFVLRQARLPLETRPGTPISVECFIDNVGCAPIYRPYRLALRLRQGRTMKVVPFKEDLRKWLPGIRWFSEKLTVPAGFKPGEVKIDIGIIGADDQPKVWFAIAGGLVDGWHPLTSIDIV